MNIIKFLEENKVDLYNKLVELEEIEIEEVEIDDLMFLEAINQN